MDVRTILVKPFNEILGLIPVLVGVVVLGQHGGDQIWWGLGVIALLICRGVLHWVTTRYRVTGGHSDAALRRAAKHGQAWIAPGGSVAGYPDLVARAEKVFAEEGRVDRPRMVSLAYFALGEDHRARGVEYLKHYYTHVGPKAEFLARGILSDAGRVRETVAGYAEAGCDELILFPGTGDPDQVDRLAEIVLP